MDVLIVDDDPLWSGMISSLLEEWGLSCEKVWLAKRAVAEIKRLKPRLVIMDIMMPDLDGLTLCKMIKNDPEIAGTKIIVASAKPFQEEREEAQRVGAEAFYSKATDVRNLRACIEGVLTLPPGAATPKPRQVRPTACRVHVWGGNSPDQLGRALTSCVALEFTGRTVLLDAGSGLKALTRCVKIQDKTLWILLTHHHEDHISHLPALAQVAAAGTVLHIAGPEDTRRPLKPIIEKNLPGLPKGSLKLFTVSESSFKLFPDLEVKTLMTRHPGSTLAFRIEHMGRSLVYCPDNEPEGDDDVKSDFSTKLAAFLRGTDVLIHDARYLDEDYPAHKGEGHACPRLAVKLAADCGARNLVLFHLDGSYSPEQLRKALDQGRTAVRERNVPMKVDLAVPGLVVDV